LNPQQLGHLAETTDASTVLPLVIGGTEIHQLYAGLNLAVLTKSLTIHIKIIGSNPIEGVSLCSIVGNAPILKIGKLK
jgi:hypothetical protein